MADLSAYKGLELPKSNERYNVGVMNSNNVIIDSELHKLELKLESHDQLLATKESLNTEISRASAAESSIGADLSEHTADETNPHHVSKLQVGLGNVDNTSDIDKPVSTAQQNAFTLAVSNHDVSASAHDDIRTLISALTAQVNSLAGSVGGHGITYSDTEPSTPADGMTWIGTK